MSAAEREREQAAAVLASRVMLALLAQRAVAQQQRIAREALRDIARTY